jgi:hypothetical protein
MFHDRDHRISLLKRKRAGQTKGEHVLLLVLLALLAIITFGVGFTVHWLFILAVVFALLWVVSLFAGAARGRSRSRWW